MKNETIQNKATQLKQELEHGLSRPQLFNEASHVPVTVKLSHCHELIAAAFGYKSKTAMRSDVHDPEIWDDQEFYTERWRDTVYGSSSVETQITNRIKQLRAPQLHKASSFTVVSIVQSALAPKCKDCGEQDPRGQFVHDGDVYEPIDFVCKHCAEDEDEYDTCPYCGDGILYPTSLLNSAGECPEHRGESYLDDEEREDWESYIENLNKDY